MATDLEELDTISTYYFNGEGKALRPMVVLLMSKAINYHLQIENNRYFLWWDIPQVGWPRFCLLCCGSLRLGYVRSLPLYGWLINATISRCESNNRGICNTLLVPDQARRRSTDWISAMHNEDCDAMTSEWGTEMQRYLPRIHFRFLHALMRSKTTLQNTYASMSMNPFGRLEMSCTLVTRSLHQLIVNSICLRLCTHSIPSLIVAAGKVVKQTTFNAREWITTVMTLSM